MLIGYIPEDPCIVFTYFYHKIQLNVGKYTIHRWYGYVNIQYDSINACCSILLTTLFASFPVA